MSWFGKDNKEGSPKKETKDPNTYTGWYSQPMKETHHHGGGGISGALSDVYHKVVDPVRSTAPTHQVAEVHPHDAHDEGRVLFTTENQFFTRFKEPREEGGPVVEEDRSFSDNLAEAAHRAVDVGAGGLHKVVETVHPSETLYKSRDPLHPVTTIPPEQPHRPAESISVVEEEKIHRGGGITGAISGAYHKVVDNVTDAVTPPKEVERTNPYTRTAPAVHRERETAADRETTEEHREGGGITEAISGAYHKVVDMGKGAFVYHKVTTKGKEAIDASKDAVTPTKDVERTSPYTRTAPAVHREQEKAPYQETEEHRGGGGITGAISGAYHRVVDMGKGSVHGVTDAVTPTKDVERTNSPPSLDRQKEEAAHRAAEEHRGGGGITGAVSGAYHKVVDAGKVAVHGVHDAMNPPPVVASKEDTSGINKPLPITYDKAKHAWNSAPMDRKTQERDTLERAERGEHEERTGHKERRGVGQVLTDAMNKVMHNAYLMKDDEKVREVPGIHEKPMDLYPKGGLTLPNNREFAESEARHEGPEVVHITKGGIERHLDRKS